jgi:S-adenosylmethionine:tRNA ribosyltransferase-isomerase
MNSDQLLTHYQFDLPAHLIAKHPVAPRDHAKLMVLNRKNQTIKHHRFDDLPTLLAPDSLVVLNNTKVMHARFFGLFKETQLECLLVKQIPSDPPGSVFEAMIGCKKKLRLQDHFLLSLPNVSIQGTVIGLPTQKQAAIVRFSSDPLQTNLGQIPLPPYLQRSTQETDSEAYQTVYAEHPGSIAAPTAGLHFEPRTFDALRQKGIQTCHLTLHVGIGTFRPIKAAHIQDHSMHAEEFFIPPETQRLISEAKQKSQPLVAIGTTTTRTLESCFAAGKFTQTQGQTEIFIRPGYRFACVDQLVTNFHLPGSTLLLLVSAFASRDFILHAYQEAIKNNYRFYSFGDAMLIQ